MPQQQTPQELCQLESKSQTLMVKKESKKKKKELRNQSPGLWAKHCHEVLVRVMIFFFSYYRLDFVRKPSVTGNSMTAR